MKLSEETIEILSSFININNSIYLDEPGYLKTKTPNSTNVIAVAKIDDVLPCVAIYSLSEFIGSLSLFNSDIDFDFTEDYINMSNVKEKIKIKYRLSDPKHILAQCKAAEDYDAFDAFDCSLKLTEEQLTNIKKAARVLGADIFSIDLTEGTGKISLVNSELPLSNSYELDVTGTGTGKAKFFTDNLVLIDGDYTVNIATDKVLKFVNDSFPIYYFLGCAII